MALATAATPNYECAQGVEVGLETMPARMTQHYREWRLKATPPLQRILPSPRHKDHLRQNAHRMVDLLGATASRALVDAIHDSLRNSKAKRDMGLPSSLYWSIPDSPKSVAALHVSRCFGSRLDGFGWLRGLCDGEFSEFPRAEKSVKRAL